MLYALRVRRGIRFLDWHVGRENWLPRINLDYLNVADGEECPLAQATEMEYWRAVRAFRLDDDNVLGRLRSMLYGFQFFQRDNVDALNEEWVRVLTRMKRDASRPRPHVTARVG